MADRRVSVGVDADVSPFVRGMATATAATKSFSGALDTSDSRMSMLVQTSLALAPALVPIGAAAVPALAGLTSQLGFAAAGAGVAVLAFQGVGDALGAVNDYQMEPTTENLAKMREELDKLGPAGQEFVMFLQELRPEMQRLQDVAQEGLFPGLQSGIDALMTRLPDIRRVISEIATASGDLMAEAGDGLASERFDDFFTYLETEARDVLLDFGRTVGNVFEGIANTWMALDPLSDGFTAGLLDWSRNFAEATRDLEDNASFQEFIAYVQENGPRAMEALGALGGALVELVKAAAPVGEVALPLIEALADGLSAIVESPAGPALVATAAGLSAISRAVALYNAANGTALAGFLGKTREDGTKAGLGLRGAAAGAGILALSLTDLDDSLGVSNTAMFGMMGMMGGPWGAAAGAAIGATMDLAAANDDLEDAILGADAAMRSMDISALESSIGRIKSEMEEFSLRDLVGAGPDPAAIEKIRELEIAINDLLHPEARTGSGWGDIFGHEMGVTAEAFDVATASGEDFLDMLENVNAVLEGRAAMRDYQAALDDFTKGLKDNGKAHGIATEKGRENNENLDRIATTALKVAENLEGMDRVRVLQRARKDFLNAADDIEIPKKQAEALADSLGLLDKKKANPKVDVKGAKESEGKIDKVQKKADKLDKSKADPLLDALDKASPKVDDAQGKVDKLDGSRAFVSVWADTGAASSALRAFQARVDSLRGKTVLIGAARAIADGGTIDGTVPGQRQPYGDKVLAYLAPGEEVITNRNGEADMFRADRAAGRIPHYADGGTAGGLLRLAGGGSVDQRLAITQALKEIADIRRELAKTGKDALAGRERRITQLELKQAQQELRETRNAPREARRAKARERRENIGQAWDGFDLSNVLPQDEPRNPLVLAVREELNTLKEGIKEAGGTWTKGMRRWAREVVAGTRELEREIGKREKLSDALDTQTQAMEELRSTMETFSGSVAGNFLSDPFNRAVEGPAPGPIDPALIAARDQLGAAQSRLSGIRGRNMDPLERAYLASKAVAEVAELRSQVEQLERGSNSVAGPTEKAVTGLEALRETLEKETEAALKFGTALDSLISKGLDTTGPFGGLFAGLAQSGDLGTAEELAALTPAQIDEYEKLFAQRGEAVASVAARATQAVYGEQQAILQKNLDVLAREMRINQRAIDRAGRQAERHGDRLENIGRRQTEVIRDGMSSVRQAIASMPRESENIRRGGRGRR